MSLIKWPFARKQYDGIDNPRYVSDIVAANEAVIDAVKALTGMNDTDFAIVSGLDYDSDALTYSAGIFYLNGLFYYISAPFVAGNYLGPNPTNIMSKGFQDGTPRFIYLQYAGLISATGGAGFSPVMNGTMNQYRIGGKYLSAQVVTLLAVAAGLGNSSTRNVGTSAGTVAAGDDPRLVYTLDQFNTLFSGKVNVGDAMVKILKGTKVVGMVPSGGAIYTVSFGLTLPDANYDVIITMIGLSATHSDDTICAPLLRTKTETEFSVYLNAPSGASAANVNFDWTVYK